MPETRFVQRAANGDVTGHYAQRQPGLAEEELPADDPAIAAYEARIDAAREAAEG